MIKSIDNLLTVKHLSEQSDEQQMILVGQL